jgi:hypothetical protein
MDGPVEMPMVLANAVLTALLAAEALRMVIYSANDRKSLKI